MNPSKSTKLIWTLNLELTPIYAIEAETAYADYVYQLLRAALAGKSLPDDDDDYVSRVSIAGVVTDRTVRLFSGQIVPVVKAQPRGLYLVERVEAHRGGEPVRLQPRHRRINSRSIPTQPGHRCEISWTEVHASFADLGQIAPDRALNYSATNTFQAAQGILRAIYPQSSGLVVPVPGSTGIYTLDTISVSKSPFCRMDSDCWDVQIGFFDPENDRRARIVLRYSVDVSDEMPVSLGPTRFFAVAG